MPFKFLGFACGRSASLKLFCQRVMRTRETPDLISLVAGEIAYINYCKEIINTDDQKRKKFDSFCREDGIDPDEMRTRVRLAAAALGFYKPNDYYGILGLSPGADEADVKRAYRKKAQLLHPDKCYGDERNSDEFIELHAAYVHLSNPDLRRAYDETRQSIACWIEGEKVSDRSTRRSGAGRFIGWMCALAGGILLIAYVFDVYQSQSSFRALKQSYEGWSEKIDALIMASSRNKSATGEITIPIAEQRKDQRLHATDETPPQSGSASMPKVASAIYATGDKKNSALKTVEAFADNPAQKAAPVKTAKQTGNKMKPRLTNRRAASKIDKAGVTKKVARPAPAAAPADIGTVSAARIHQASGVSAIEEKMDAQTVYLLQKQRVLAFLQKYTKAYEDKNLRQFKTFFTSSALEQGRPFVSLLPTYRQTFDSVKVLQYKIEPRLISLEKGGNKIYIEGDFSARFQLPDSHWGRCAGFIRMELLDAVEGLMISRMDYEVESRDR